MRLNSKFLALIINFFLGFFWALALLGGAWGLVSNFHIGLFYALSSVILWSVPGVFGVLVVEVFLSSLERTQELKEHTKLLKKIAQASENTQN